MPDPKRERDRLRNTIRHQRQEIQDLHRITGKLAAEYTAILIDLEELAIHGCRRPADLGGPINTGYNGSRPPATQPNRAYDLLRREVADQRRRAQELRRKYQRLIDGDNHEEAPQPVRTLANS